MNRIIFALDTTNLDKAVDIAQRIKNKIFTIKLGLEFFNAHGKEGVKKFNEIGITNLMLDLKLKDIPETVYKAIKALGNVQFGFLTIHGQGGKSMIDKAKKAADEIKSQPKIMMVTILTALNDEDLKATGSNSTVNEQVEKLAKVAKEMEVGIVCSGHEAKLVRKIIGPDLLISTSLTSNSLYRSTASLTISNLCTVDDISLSAFIHGSPAGTNTTRSSPNWLIAPLAIATCPICIGSNVPPSIPILLPE